MADFWRTCHHDGKFSPGWVGWGVHAHLLSLNLPSHTKLLCMLQLKGAVFHLYPYMYSVVPFTSGFSPSPKVFFDLRFIGNS
jgi:hypothetical protein